jgi:hypothetical protein
VLSGGWSRDGRAKIANGEGVAQARMDSEDQRQTIKPGGRSPDRDDGEVFAKVDVHHIGPQGEDRSDDCRLESVELTKTSDGESHSYYAGVVSKALETWRGRRVVSTVCTTPRRSSARVSSAVWFCIPPMGSNFTPRPTSAEGGGSNTEQSLSTLIRVLSVLLISKESPEEPLAAFDPRPPLHTTLIRLLVG